MILSNPRDRREYYREEAKKLREQDSRTRRELQDHDEATRLEDLAQQADEHADGLEEQIHEACK